MGKTVAFIPVRGGSKSIPLKNIKPIAGKPLVAWTIEAAQKCDQIDEVVVSTDSDEIRKVVSQLRLPKVRLVDRSEESASDTASTEAVMLEFLEKEECETFILIQATSPLISKSDLSKGLSTHFKKSQSSVMSVVRQKRFIWNEQADGSIQSQNYDVFKRPRRQEFDGYLVENGAFYISTRDSILKTRNRVSGTIFPVEMPEETYFEIDEPSDWKIMEQLLLQRNAENSTQKSKIKVFITDVDGVLTDGGMYYDNEGNELKKFHTRDGKGLELLRKSGVKVGIITGEDTAIVDRRASKLNVDFLYQGISDKLSVLNQVMQNYSVAAQEIAYIGDDVNDFEVLSIVGWGACPNDAVPEIRAIASKICATKGGRGCVREFAEEVLMHNQGK